MAKGLDKRQLARRKQNQERVLLGRRRKDFKRREWQMLPTSAESSSVMRTSVAGWTLQHKEQGGLELSRSGLRGECEMRKWRQ